MTLRLKTLSPFLFLLSLLFFIKPGIEQNFWLLAFVLIQSVFLLLLFEEKIKIKISRKFLLLAIPVLLGLFVVGSGVYKDTFKVTNFEKNVLWTRQELYRRELGLIGRSNFGNRFIEQTKLTQDKIFQKITEPYELTHYFSTESNSFYSLFFLPFFAFGFLYMLSTKTKATLFYMGFATMGAIMVPPDMTYWLFIPLINLGILMSLLKIKEILKTK